MIGLVFSFSEEPDVFDKPGFDVLIVHELTENVEFLAQELISKVNLNRNECLSMRSDSSLARQNFLRTLN